MPNEYFLLQKVLKSAAARHAMNEARRREAEMAEMAEFKIAYNAAYNAMRADGQAEVFYNLGVLHGSDDDLSDWDVGGIVDAAQDNQQLVQGELNDAEWRVAVDEFIRGVETARDELT